jgi:CHAT domain-containing protein
MMLGSNCCRLSRRRLSTGSLPRVAALAAATRVPGAGRMLAVSLGGDAVASYTWSAPRIKAASASKRSAGVALLDHPLLDEPYPFNNPVHWAAFVVIGKG